MKNSFPLFLLTTTGAIAAQNCDVNPPMCHTVGDCSCTYCLGPAQKIANAPVRPYTCNGDWEIAVSGFYWKPSQDGLEYAVENNVAIPNFNSLDQLNNLINAEYKNPDFKWDFGFKLKLGYNTTCDGWDIGATWTRFRGKADSHVEAEADDNHALIPLWTAFRQVGFDRFNYATDIQTSWNLDLDLIDIELGRGYWLSPVLQMRPFMGLRIARINQNYDIQHKGGLWTGIMVTPQNNEVDLDNKFKGVGVRSGLDLAWNFRCGWSLYSNLAASIVYGRFDLEHDEENRQAESPFTKTKILETKESFRASRAMLDLGLGIRWFSLIADCQYGVGASLGYEQHLFFHQNQLWRVDRVLNVENVYGQTRGTLGTQGWTLTVQFDF